jgi:hypothetical protein
MLLLNVADVVDISGRGLCHRPMIVVLALYGPVPPSPPSLIGALVLIGTGVVGFIHILLHIARGGLNYVSGKKLLFFSVILLGFILGGLVELSHVK